MSKQISTIERYPELNEIANDIFRDAITVIRIKAHAIKSEMPYKEQYILEKLIQKLEKRV